MAAKGDKMDWKADKKMVAFILDLEKHGNATTAMEKVGVGRGKIWHKCKTDPEFDAVYKAARQCGLGVLRDHGYKMAMGQLDEETFKVSDASMLRFLVQQHDRSFNPTQKVELGGEGMRPFMFQMVMDDKAMKDEKNDT